MLRPKEIRQSIEDAEVRLENVWAKEEERVKEEEREQGDLRQRESPLVMSPPSLKRLPSLLNVPSSSASSNGSRAWTRPSMVSPLPQPSKTSHFPPPSPSTLPLFKVCIVPVLFFLMHKFFFCSPCSVVGCISG